MGVLLMLITIQNCAWYTPVPSRYYHAKWMAGECMLSTFIGSIRQSLALVAFLGWSVLIWTLTLNTHGWSLLQARLHVICSHRHLTTIISAFQRGLFHAAFINIPLKWNQDPTIYWVGQRRIRLEKEEKAFHCAHRLFHISRSVFAS